MVDPTQIAEVFRGESGRAIASLVRRFGDIDMAEEAVQEAFLEAVRRWPENGLPPSPAGWIITTARNRVIDRLRRESTRDDRQRQAMFLHQPDDEMDEYDIEDDRLRLIFTCCHPSLDTPAQVALTLRLIGGLQTPEIARAFLVPETTMAQRLVRAKRKIKANKIPYRVPSDAELPNRLRPVLAVVYLIFNEGYLSSQGDTLTRDDLAVEGMRLARVLAELMPDEPEVIGLLALILLTMARRPARVSNYGTLVRLPDQDRRLWHRPLIDEGQELVRACLRRNRPGPFQIQAAIAAVHADAPSSEETDWSQVLLLYDQLMAISPSPVVALNRAIALAEVDGPEAALEAVDSIDLDRYHLLWATRGDLLSRLGRHEEAAQAFRTALDLTSNPVEREYLEQRLATR